VRRDFPAPAVPVMKTTFKASSAGLDAE